MSHITEITVSWGDTDAAGLIYFPRFFHFVVIGINDYFTEGLEGAHLMEQLRQEGYFLPAVDVSASFLSPLRAGNTARIETTIIDSGDTSFTISFIITRISDSENIATGEVTFVLVDDEFQPVTLPHYIREHIDNGAKK